MKKKLKYNKSIPDSEIINSVIGALQSKYKDINAKTLASNLGYKTPMSIYHITRGVNSISEDMIERIIKNYPEVNYFFLKKGEGSPLKEENAILQKNLFDPNRSIKKQEIDLNELPVKINEMYKMIKEIHSKLFYEQDGSN